ncbi:DNA-directed RNA polymerase subunit beta', partial [Pediococcus acidilactici]|nr:DNA-directed RNA polymerase subunit beta' [Pediococcus acidilactici]
TLIGMRAISMPEKPFTDQQRQQILITTAGKMLFNDILPKDFVYLNAPTNENLVNGTPDEYFLEAGEDIHEQLNQRPLLSPFKSGFLSDVIAEVYKQYKVTETSLLLDRMKDLGFYRSTLSGLTVGIADITNLPDKPAIIAAAHKKVATVTK